MKRYLLLTSLAAAAATALFVGPVWAQSDDLDYEDEEDEEFEDRDFDEFEFSSSDEDDNVARLTGDNFYDLTAGKRSFIKFYDPMWGHCVLMAEDWAQLAEDYIDEKDDILIGKVDCTKQQNKLLCQTFGVTGYPTLLYGDIVDLKVYKGERDLGDLRDVVEDELNDGPICSVRHTNLCDDDLKERIDSLVAKGLPALNQEISQLETKMQELEKIKDQAVADLQKQYSFEMKRKDALKLELEQSSNLVLMKQILQSKKDALLKRIHNNQKGSAAAAPDSHDEL